MIGTVAMTDPAIKCCRGISEELSAAGLIGAVRAASVDIRQGEIFVIMGLSGSGKSTLVRCMSRLIEPTAGEILLDDRDLLQADEAQAPEVIPLLPTALDVPESVSPSAASAPIYLALGEAQAMAITKLM